MNKPSELLCGVPRCGDLKGFRIKARKAPPEAPLARGSPHRPPRKGLDHRARRQGLRDKVPSAGGQAAPAVKLSMCKIKAFPSPSYVQQQPSDPVVPQLSMHRDPNRALEVWHNRGLDTNEPASVQGLLGADLQVQPSINVDDGWLPVKRYKEETMNVDRTRQQVYFDDSDEPTLRRIIKQQRKIAEPPSNSR